MARRLKRPYEQAHTTRMVPKRVDEIVAPALWAFKSRRSSTPVRSARLTGL